MLGFATGLAILFARAARFTRTPAEWAALTVGAALGYLLADFMSGFFHWVGDTLGDERTPVLGRTFIVPFRQHHVHPKEIADHDFLHTNGNSSIVALPFYGAVIVGCPDPEAPGLFVTSFIASGGLWCFLTNQFHKWAHADRVPGLVRGLQRWGVILSPERHAKHHTPPYDGHFCITSGWLSGPLDRIGFFRGLERIVGALRPGLVHRERRA